MAEFKINQFRYTWKGSWVTGTAYKRDDVVRYGAKSYVCVRTHEADVDFYNDLYYTVPGDTAPSPAWVKMTDGFAFRNNWELGQKYNLGDVVLYGGVLYLCIQDYTSSVNFDQGIDNWIVYADSINWRLEWQQATRYGIGDLVKYGGIIYRCTQGHLSAGTFAGLEVDSGKWEVYYNGVSGYVGEWEQNTRYKENDLVKYGGSLLRVITGHTSSTNIDSSKFQTEVYGFNFYQEWDQSIYYAVGDVVRHGGYVYRANSNNYNHSPGDDTFVSAERKTWTVITKGVNVRGVWSSSEFYKTGDVVRRGGYLYVATSDTSDDGSTLDYLDSSNWELVVPSQNWRGVWTSGQTYSINDVVTFYGGVYVCTQEHFSNDNPANYPGDNGEGVDFWDLTIKASSVAGLRAKGDLLTYDLVRGDLGDGSTFGNTGVKIGARGHYVTVGAEDNVEYSSWGNTNRVFAVSATNGIDDDTDPERGINPEKPFKTIRYACEYADDGFAGTTTVEVETGTYHEILPIIVPARTVVLGDELRSVKVVAAGPIEALQGDVTYTLEILGRFREIINGIVLGGIVNKTSGNTVTQIFPQVGEEGNSTSSLAAQSLIDDMISYIDFYVNGQGSAPTVSGSNIITSETSFLNAANLISDNKQLFIEEAVAFMQFFYPQYNFDSDRCRRDARRYIEAVVYDLRRAGNYKSVLAARYYANAVNGSEREDMFYLRDATGVRNMTLSGLNGTLNPPNTFDLYRRPTGGAYCSLDPGWGPDDERVWINTRSPYIQGVTNFGYSCTGQKIDGALHNGGYRSMVSNDFTQVLSDGIGAWVLNNGRAELVSVFTYYCSIGYLAEAGGRIRATNGNNSYGRFGAIADGVDSSEIPRTGYVNNRNNQAYIAQAGAFAGEVNDEILILEFANAGQNYTTANYTFIGSGTNANVVQDETRDGAIFESRVIDPEDSTGFGGGGFILIGNNAQVSSNPATDLTGITIASNDQNTEENYLGMRIVLTSGNGTGQYGVITSYNEITKVVTVKKESDDQPGWDHVIPGYPLATFTTATQYRIEARPIFSDPPFITTEIALPLQVSWAAIGYGETTETYTNISGDPGLSEDTENPPVTATWNIIKNGRDYVVTTNNPGAGYVVGQTIIISGDDVGGVNPDNNITITVTGTTADSTDAITEFTYTGNGASGRFVLTPSVGQAGLYSSDGVTWTDMQLPSTGNWNCIAAGDNKFVAIKTGTNQAASSLDGITWTARSMPTSRDWSAVAYGGGRFVAVARNLNGAAYSTNGTTWITATLPSFGDSTYNEWVDVVYGKNHFIALANSGNVIATSHDGGVTWTGSNIDPVGDSTQHDWVSIAYGNNRYVVMASNGTAAYSFDGEVWYNSEMPKQDGSTLMNWKKMKYANGVFVAICDTGGAVIGGDPTTGETTYVATSDDGISWIGRELSSNEIWSLVGYGNPQLPLNDSTLLEIGKNTPTWVLVPEDVTGIINKVHVGTRAKGRVVIDTGRITQVKLWDVGSGYNESPALTLVDPNRTSLPVFDNRIGDKVLAQPSWINRGLGYKTSTTDVLISGDGFADVKPVGKFITLSGLSTYPRQGSQLIFDGSDTIYTCAIITPLNGLVSNGGLSATIRVQPEFDTITAPEHKTAVLIRERFSQCRITGHDFLDIGTGNFEETNYPSLYSTGLYTPAPENEVYEEGGGRVFYTSTDQSGNFRAGELFSVEQATGIVTVSADYFDLGGLSELKLGGVRLGGSGVVIREFSTDPLFSEDSNNVVPTQRAIKAYLANRLSVGGSEIATASFIAGTVRVGPERFASTTNGSIIVPVKADFSGASTHISGSILAQLFFAKSFKDAR